MSKPPFLRILLIFLLISPLYAQQTPTEDEVVKVSTNLVQVDAVVTDKSGKPVTNLAVNDFVLLQDGKPQNINDLSYVSRTTNNESAAPAPGKKSGKSDKKPALPPIAAGRAHGGEFGRILTFVVDDSNCDATFGGISAVEKGLEKFINEQMQPDDSVAIYQTREGNSLLQQYTSDKIQLLRIVRKIRWYPPKGFCSDVTGSDHPAARDNSTGKGEGTFDTAADRKRNEDIEDSQRDEQIPVIVAVMKYVINGLRPISGRKVLFMMTDSLAASDGRKIYRKNLQSIQDVIAAANRASVVINAIDVRGLTVPSVSAEDNIRISSDPSTIKKVDEILEDRARFDSLRQSGMSLVADQTSGKFYKNINFLDNPIRMALQSETGYYLLSYQPEGDTFEGKKFHKIEIKLKNSDYSVSSRAGFFGVTDEALRPKAKSGDSELYELLSAPLPNADMNIQLSAYFANTPAKGNVIHTAMYIEGKDISFTEQGGKKKAVFDIVAVTMDDKNKVIDDSNYTAAVVIPADSIDLIQHNGLIYTVDVPVKKAGVYTFRTAVRNPVAKRLGSASQTIEVPELKKSKLFVSGLIISGVDAAGRIYPPETEKAANDFVPVVSKAIPAIREFRRRTVIGYAYSIYNAKLTNNQPNLTIQTNLYHDGTLISEGKPQPAQIEKQVDMSRIRDYSYLRLNPDVPPGDYTLQIIVKDLATNQTSNQSIDFQIVEK